MIYNDITIYITINTYRTVFALCFYTYVSVRHFASCYSIAYKFTRSFHPFCTQENKAEDDAPHLPENNGAWFLRVMPYNSLRLISQYITMSIACL